MRGRQMRSYLSGLAADPNLNQEAVDQAHNNMAVVYGAPFQQVADQAAEALATAQGQVQRRTSWVPWALLGATVASALGAIMYMYRTRPGRPRLSVSRRKS